MSEPTCNPKAGLPWLIMSGRTPALIAHKPPNHEKAMEGILPP